MQHDEFIAACEVFLKTYPLYTKLRAELRDSREVAILPHKLILYCHVCEDDFPFRPAATSYSNTEIFSRDYIHKMTCTGCNTFEYIFWMEANREQGWIRKIGQRPEWSIKIPADLKKELGDDAPLYQKALTLMSQSYGLGACVYFRRLIENHINPLLELVREINQLQGNTDKVAKVDAALTGKDFSTKIHQAADLLPDSIAVGGMNPIRLIYEKLSISIHSLSDDEAMGEAMVLRSSFDYLLRELSGQINSKRRWVDSMKKLSGDTTGQKGLELEAPESV